MMPTTTKRILLNYSVALWQLGDFTLLENMRTLHTKAIKNSLLESALNGTETRGEYRH